MRGALLARFVVTGEPPTKKNTPIPFHAGAQGRGTMNDLFAHLAKRTAVDPAGAGAELRALAEKYRLIILPSKDYTAAKRWWLPAARKLHAQAGKPIAGTADTPVIVGGIFYLGARRHPDLLSLCEALSDLLQESGWIANDYHIVRWWEGTRRERDVANPRTEVLLWAYEESRCQSPPQLPFEAPRTS